MTNTDQCETELERLREEIRTLRRLLVGRDTTKEGLAASEEKVALQTGQLAEAASDRMQQARLFEKALSSIVDFAYVFNKEGRFTYVNQALLSLWQMALEDALGKNFFDLNYPEALATRLQHQIQTVFETGQTLRDETPYTAESGKEGYYEYILVPVFGPDGQVEAVAGSTRDISARHAEQTEKETRVNALEMERTRLKDLFMQAPAFITILRGPEHIFELANPLYHQLIGPERKILGKPVREALPEVEGQGFFELLDEVYRTGKPFIGKATRILLQDKPDAPPRERYLDFVYQPLLEADGSVSGIFAHGVDLTEQKYVEEALRASKERVRLATEAAGLGIWVWEPASDTVTWENDRMYEIYGLLPSDPLLTSAQFLDEVVHPDDAQAFAHAIARPVETGEPLYFEGRFRRKDGVLRWIEFRGRLQEEKDGEPLRVVGTAADITDRKTAQEALRASKESLDLAIDGAQLGTFYCEVPFDKIIWNDTCKEHFFLPPDADVDFDLFYSLLHPEDREPTRQAIERAMSERVQYNVEYRTVASDGRTRWINAIGRGYFSAVGEPLRFDGITMDITKNKSRERALKLLVAINDATRTLYEPEAIMGTAARLLGEHLGVSRCAYAPVEEDEDHFTIYEDYTNGCATSAGHYVLTAFGPRAVAKLCKGHTYILNDRNQEATPEDNLAAFKALEIQAIICTSLIKDGKLKAMMAVHQVTPRTWTAEEIHLVEMVAERCWAIIERAQASKELTERAEEIASLNSRLKRAMTETHHRVKNNLQMIAAMVEMPLTQHQEKNAIPIEEFVKLRAHVHTLATVHDLLTKSVKEEEEAQRISVKIILDKLLPMLGRATGAQQLSFAVEDARFASKQCISLALIINELVTNALKHGKNQADVIFRIERDQAILEVSDDGPGFKEGFSALESANMGLEIVESLIQTDLGGASRYETRPEGGGRVTVSFPVPSGEL